MTPELFPATPNQEALWIFQDLHPESPAYNLAFALDFRGPLDTGALERSVEGVLQRHEALRTTFLMSDGALHQAVHAPTSFTLPITDLAAVEEPERAGRAEALSRAEAGRPFQLDAAAPIRFHLVRLGHEEHRLLFIQHHAVSDGISTALLLDELAERYAAGVAGRAPTLPEQEIDFPDYALWLRDQNDGDVVAADWAYWTDRLGDAPVPEPLPLPSPDRDVGARGRWIGRDLPGADSERLRALAEGEQATLFQVALAGVFALLHRYSGDTDLTVGIPVDNRPLDDTARLVGYLANTVVIRADVQGEQSFRSLLRAVRARVWEAVQHQEWPFAEVVRALRPQRSGGATPFFRVMLMQRQLHASRLRFGPLEASVTTLDHEAPKFDFCFDLHDEGGHVSLGLYYDAETFGAWATEAFLDALVALVTAAAADPQCTVGTLPLLEAAAAAATKGWGRGEAAPTVPGLLHEQVHRQAIRQPDAVALVAGEEQITYATLDRRANALARRLVRAGVAVGDVVAVVAPRSSDAVVALLGVLKAGGAYLPLAPDDPPQRWQQVVTDASASAIVLPRGEVVAPHAVTVITVDVEEQAVPPGVEVTLKHPAYVLYTSGSTGKPKGVVVSHRAVGTYLAWATEAYGLRPSSIIPLHTALSFDLTVTALWGGLTTGGRLDLVPDDEAVGALAERLSAGRRYALLKLTPAHLQALEHLCNGRMSIDVLVVGGEALSSDLVARYLRASPGIRVVNEYGPTEAAVGCCIHEVSEEVDYLPGPGRGVPIGRPTPGTLLCVLDRYGSLVPPGLPGELYIAGSQLAEGYLHQQELTAQRFVDNPLRAGERVYRTGDVARWRADGELEFVGRLDDQVKVRGYRVELGEVEAALQAHPSVASCAAVVREDTPGDRRLVAYVVAGKGTGADGSGGTDAALTPALRQHARERLPSYMVPAHVVVLPALPTTPNGKVDRKALPAPDASRAAAGVEFAAPRTNEEEVLARIVADVLRLDRVGVDDNLFELGADSMLVFRIGAGAQRVGLALEPRDFFRHQTVAELATAATSGSTPSSLRELPRVAVRNEWTGSTGFRLPASSMQESMWALAGLSPESAASYNMPCALRLRGPLDEAALEAALRRTVERHEPLRTTFYSEGGAVYQLVGPEAFSLDHVDFTGKPGREREEDLQRALEEQAQLPMSLEHGPLFRARLYRLAPEDHCLFLLIHHSVFDGESMDILLEEVAEAYAAIGRGQAEERPAPALQHGDYAAWQKARIDEGELRPGVEFWRDYLAGSVHSTPLPTRFSRPPAGQGRAAYETADIPSDTSERVGALARREGSTVFAVLLAAFYALLYRYTGQGDLSVGVPSSERTREELEGLIGPFLNTLVTRVRVVGPASFRDLLAEVRQAFAEAFSHADVPFDLVVKELQPDRHIGENPLFDVMFVFEQSRAAGIRFGDAYVEVSSVRTKAAKFPLTFTVADMGGHLGVHVEYDAARYERSMVRAFVRHYVTALESAIESPEAEVARLPILTIEERRAVSEVWSVGGVASPCTALDATGREGGGAFLSVSDCIAMHAVESPGVLALDDGTTALTFSELLAWADGLASHLVERGVRKGDRIGVFLERSTEAVVALLAVWRAGGVQVPIDPSYPSARIHDLVSDAALAAVITSRALRGGVPDGKLEIIDVCAKDIEQWVSSREPHQRADVSVGPDDLAYIIYTSGSTGRPKGVMIEHGALEHYLRWATHVYTDGPVTSGVGSAVHSSLSFDLTVTGLWGALVRGTSARLLAEGEGVEPLVDALEEHPQFSILKLTPSHLRLLVAHASPGVLNRLEGAVVVGGEQLDSGTVIDWCERAPRTQVFNEYGPTEATVGCCVHRVGSIESLEAGGVVPIGRPSPGTRLYVLDKRGEPVPVGVPGELYIGGAQLARGYFNRPEGTNERFVPHPNRVDERLYRTGDIVKWQPDGSLVFLGRNDDQVKVRGHRIELSEVEAHIAEHPDVIQVAAAVRELAAARNQLVAYVATRGETSGADIRECMRLRVPPYMVPSLVVVLDTLPLTPNGKVDREALPEPVVGAEAAPRRVPPRTDVERALVRVAEGVLRLDSIGVHDNLFDLGADSMLVYRLTAEAKEAGVVVEPRQFFRHQTIAELAREVKSVRRNPAEEEEALRQRVLRMMPEEVQALLAEKRARAQDSA